MIREEIIKGLEICSKDFPDRDCGSCPNGFYVGCALDLKEMALMELRDVPDTNVGDMISRQAAIDAVPDVPIASAFTDEERYYISDIFQNYHCLGIKEIAEEDELSKSIFQKVGLLDG